MALPGLESVACRALLHVAEKSTEKYRPKEPPRLSFQSYLTVNFFYNAR